jgi:O-antigen ligase
MLYVASKPLAYWFSYKSDDTLQGSPFDRLFMIALIFAALFLLKRRNFSWTNSIRESLPLFIMVLFMLASVLWAKAPMGALKGWMRELLAILMAFSVLSEPFPKQAIESVIRRTTYILIPFSLVLIKYFPHLGIEYTRWSGERMWIGVTLQKNSLAQLCYISIFFLIWSLTKRRNNRERTNWKYENHAELLLLAISIYLLFGPEHNPFYSATSFYALLLGISLYAGLLFAKRSRMSISSAVFIAFAASIIIFGTILPFASHPSVGLAASAAGRSNTLTGRTEVWAALKPAVMNKPLLGAGYNGFWTRRTRDFYEISGAHNGYLEVLLAFGSLGLILVSIFYLSSCYKAHCLISVDFYWGALWICLLLMFLLQNIAEASMETLANQRSAILLILAVSYSNLSLQRS